MKKPWKIITLIFVSGILFVLLLGLWLGTQNIYLGSADYTKTVFDFDKSDTVWECKEVDAIGYVTDDELIEYCNYLKVTFKKEKYIFRPRGHRYIDVYIDNGEIPPKVIKTIPVRYKKWLGEIYAFKISGIDKSNILLDGNDTLVFSPA